MNFQLNFLPVPSEARTKRQRSKRSRSLHPERSLTFAPLFGYASDSAGAIGGAHEAQRSKRSRSLHRERSLTFAPLFGYASDSAGAIGGAHEASAQ